MEKGIIKFALSMILANVVRFCRFIPNNDPIMAMMLPYSKQNSVWKAFLFPFITMISFDAITGYLGVWTVVTSLTYGGLGLMFTYIYGKRQRAKKKVGLKIYLGSGVLGVLVFDFITGVIATPLMFGMAFEQAFLGQIPFTFLHLLTVSVFVIVITPLLDRHVLSNPKLEDSRVLSFFSKPTLS